MARKILITGGTGYIGSHTAVELMNANHSIVIVDNLCNSSIKVLERLEKLAGKNFTFVKSDIRNGEVLDQIFKEHNIDTVVHFAGLKAVGESVKQPLRYFENNVGGTLALIQAMDRASIHRLIFSSSATVYGDPTQVPITESSQLQPTNPYGRSKLMCEDILRDLQASDPRWHVAILRYFNPVGAHVSGIIGENPSAPPNNLLPIINQVAIGKRNSLSIFGNDFPTSDGTGVRDYIHVCDLAKGHLAALNYLWNYKTSITVNLGTGHGISVKELIDEFSKVTGINIPYQFTARRPGDVATSYADISFAQHVLAWKAELSVEQICADAWRWQSKNPNGY
jgi:UDP-glucose 4-epimerase